MRDQRAYADRALKTWYAEMSAPRLEVVHIAFLQVQQVHVNEERYLERQGYACDGAARTAYWTSHVERIISDERKTEESTCGLLVQVGTWVERCHSC